jgi:RimJ/RimL family protein N-acetyltransferase
MVLNKKLLFRLDGVAAEFRSLRTGDVSDAYVRALRQQRAYLENNPEDLSLESQQGYVEAIVKSDSKSISGLFIAGELVGTAGMQNLVRSGPATIGIFILDPAMRGRGYGKTLVWCSCELSHECRGVAHFGAGMKKTNSPSFHSFMACGFVIVQETQDDYQMEAHIPQLIKPVQVREVCIMDENAGP